MSEGCVRLEFDAEALDALLGDVEQSVARERLMETFIRHDASREMMGRLFSMTPRAYARARQALGVVLTTGRIRELSPDEAQLVFDAWQDEGGKHDPKTYLAVSERLEIPLRVIWEELTKNYPVHAAASEPARVERTVDGTWPRPSLVVVEKEHA